MRLTDRTAVVTGAANGIGRAIAVALARRGCHLALADIDEDGMDGTAELVRGIERRQPRILVGSDARTISLIARLLPVSYWKFLARRAGSQ